MSNNKKRGIRDAIFPSALLFLLILFIPFSSNFLDFFQKMIINDTISSDIIIDKREVLLSYYECFSNSHGRKSAASLYRKPYRKGQVIKSSWYRDFMVPLMGKSLTVEAPRYEIHDKTRDYVQVLMLGVVVMESDTSLNPMPGLRIIDHMWTRISWNVRNWKNDVFTLDPKRPLRIKGLVNEYKHPKNDFFVRNIGIEPEYVSQVSWYFTEGQLLGAVPLFFIMMWSMFSQ